MFILTERLASKSFISNLYAFVRRMPNLNPDDADTTPNWCAVFQCFIHLGCVCGVRTMVPCIWYTFYLFHSTAVISFLYTHFLVYDNSS